MSRNEIHVGDTPLFTITIKDSDTGLPRDISEVSTITFLFRSPTRVVTEVDAEYGFDGTDGVLEYQVPDNTLLSVSGLWKLQARVTWDATHQLTSDIYEFDVYSNVD